MFCESAAGIIFSHEFFFLLGCLLKLFACGRKVIKNVSLFNFNGGYFSSTVFGRLQPNIRIFARKIINITEIDTIAIIIHWLKESENMFCIFQYVRGVNASPVKTCVRKYSSLPAYIFAILSLLSPNFAILLHFR